MYDFGLGVPMWTKPRPRAYRQAADKGETAAGQNLAVLYLPGTASARTAWRRSGALSTARTVPFDANSEYAHAGDTYMNCGSARGLSRSPFALNVQAPTRHCSWPRTSWACFHLDGEGVSRDLAGAPARAPRRQGLSATRHPRPTRCCQYPPHAVREPPRGVEEPGSGGGSWGPSTHGSGDPAREAWRSDPEASYKAFDPARRSVRLCPRLRTSRNGATPPPAAAASPRRRRGCRRGGGGRGRSRSRPGRCRTGRCSGCPGRGPGP